MTEPGYFSPELPEMLAAVRDCLKELAPKMDRGTAYQLQVSSFLLDVALRELAGGEAAVHASAQRYRRLLDSDGSVHEQMWKLCRALRDGSLDQRWDEALQLLLDDLVTRVAIVRPDVLAPEHRTKTE